ARINAKIPVSADIRKNTERECKRINMEKGQQEYLLFPYADVFSAEDSLSVLLQIRESGEKKKNTPFSLINQDTLVIHPGITGVKPDPTAFYYYEIRKGEHKLCRSQNIPGKLFPEQKDTTRFLQVIPKKPAVPDFDAEKEIRDLYQV